MVLVIGTFALMAIVLIVTIVRVSLIAGWRSVVTVAIATGSLKAAIAFIRYCEQL